MVDVVLQDDEALPRAPGGASPGAAIAGPEPAADRGDSVHDGTDVPAATPGRGRRPGRWFALAAAVAVVVGAGAVRSAQEREEAARVAALPGMVESFATPLRPTWSVPVDGVAWTVGELVLVGSRGALTAIDARTGEQRWTSDADGADARAVTCTGTRPDRPADAVVACVVDGPDRVVLLDAETGGTLRVLETAVFVQDLEAVGGDLVLATAGPSRVERLDARTGEVRWSTDVPPATVRQTAVADGFVTISGERAAVLDVEDGELLGSWPSHTRGTAGRPLTVVQTAPQGFGVWEEGAQDDARGRWFSRDGREVGEIRGWVAEPTTSDGSEPSVLLTLTPEPELRALDADREVLWSLDPLDGLPVVRLDGRVVLAGAETLRSVELLTGEVEWSVDLGRADAVTAVSDGERLLVVSSSGDTRVLRAISLRDGSTAWTSAVPGGGEVLGGEPDVVLVRDGDVLVGLG